ncbi:MAG: hypothetical protein R6U50_09390 [Desulfobacterales bacterium]
MKRLFDDSLDLTVYSSDSPEAEAAGVKRTGAVFVNGEKVPLKIALSGEKMEAFLRGIVERQSNR